MNKEFVPYEQALALKELGFKEPCFGRYWNGELKILMFSEQFINPSHVALAPTFSQAFRWFREKYMLKGIPDHSNSNGSYKWIIWKWNHDNNVGKWEKISYPTSYFTYEEAELACLDKLIEIVKLRGFEDLLESRSLPSL